MRNLVVRIVAMVLCTALATACSGSNSRQTLVAGRYGQVRVVAPQGEPRGVVIYFTGGAQLAAPELQLANALAQGGAWVAVLDAASYRQRLGDELPACKSLADDAALLTQKLLKQERAGQFFLPLLVGQGRQAALVRATAAGAAAGEYAGVLVAQDEGGPLACSGAGDAVAVEAVPVEALVPRALVALTRQAGAVQLPLVEMPVAGSRRLAVLLSGDGGWRDLDRGIARELNQRGISVLGWNSLRYFWKPRSPHELGADLGEALRTYRQRWDVDDVALIGYSFGADVLPFAYPQLPPEQQQPVRLMSLLGMSRGAVFEVHVGRWLGWGRAREIPVLPALEQVQGVQLQCVYGRSEKNSLCRELRGKPYMQVIERPGGHHFDRDPAALASSMLEAWNAAPAKPSPEGPPLR